MTKRSTQWHHELEKKILSNPESAAEYKAFLLQLELCEKMKKAREKAHLTQGDVARTMGTKIPVISRLEGNAPNMHSPSLVTLVKYANAIGKELRISFVKSA